MKYVVHYTTRHTAVLDCIGKPNHEDLRAHAVWQAKNASGRVDVEITQILPEGVESHLGNDNPDRPDPFRPLPKPPQPPGTPHAGDKMLQRAA